jgi:hypothetical protein
VILIIPSVDHDRRWRISRCCRCSLAQTPGRQLHVQHAGVSLGWSSWPSIHDCGIWMYQAMDMPRNSILDEKGGKVGSVPGMNRIIGQCLDEWERRNDRKRGSQCSGPQE